MADDSALVIFRKQLGDVLLMQPALEHLAKRYKTINLYAKPGFADLLELMPGQIRAATVKARPFFYTDVYCLENRPSAVLQSIACLGARRHLLLSRDRALAWQRALFDEYRFSRLDGTTYRGLLYYELVGGLAEDFAPPHLAAPPAEWKQTPLPEQYVLIHPTAAWRHKAWHAGHWVRLIKSLPANISWVLTTGPADWEVALAADIAREISVDRMINLAGKTALREYLYVISRAQALFCIDGSASHIAAAFGVPCLTLFGRTSADRWHWQRPNSICLRADRYGSAGEPDVNNIPLDAVNKAAYSLLGEVGCYA